MERQIGKYYLYSYDRGLLIREATPEEASQAENTKRKTGRLLYLDEGTVQKFLGVNAPYSQGTND